MPWRRRAASAVSSSRRAWVPCFRARRFTAASSRRAACSAWPSCQAGSTSAAGSSRASRRFSTRRWVAVSKMPRESISSSKNSQRTGCSIPGENTSRMPPRRANCPGPSTWSHRVYPAPASRRARSPRSHRWPTARVRTVRSSTRGGMHRCTRASGVVTTTGLLPRRYRAASRWFSHWRLASMGRHCSSRAGSTSGSSPVSTRRSPACRRASRSSGHSTTSGRRVFRCRAASTWARCTGLTPVISTGLTPFSTSSVSCRTSVRRSSSFISAFTGHLPSSAARSGAYTTVVYAPKL